MRRLLLAGLFIVGLSTQTNLTGEWELQLTTPRGPLEYKLYLTHEGPRLTGHLSSEYGEQPVRGTVNGDEVKISWSEMENGKPLDITLTGTVKGDTITGTARLGNVGEGPFRADRTDG
jgi:hypothetical protein